MNSEVIFQGLSDEAVVLVALLWESGATANADPEAAGLAERVNDAMPDLITEELKRREIEPKRVGFGHFTTVIERVVEQL